MIVFVFVGHTFGMSAQFSSNSLPLGLPSSTPHLILETAVMGHVNHVGKVIPALGGGWLDQ